MHFDHSRAPLELVPAGKKELGDEKSFQPSNAKEKYDSLAISVALYKLKWKTNFTLSQVPSMGSSEHFLGVGSRCLSQFSVHWQESQS